MQSLARLAGWGTAAAVSLALAAMSVHSSHGQQRLIAIFPALAGGKSQTDSALNATIAAQAARIAETERLAHRLSEIVESLSGERHQLLARVTELERNLGEVTGSLERQVRPQTPAVDSQPTQVSGSADPAASPATGPTHVQASAQGKVSSAEERPAAVMGIDVGGAGNFDGLRKLWAAISSGHPELFEALHPLAAVRENTKTRGADLRLIVGPLPDADAATRICAALAAAKRPCRVTPFEGRQFSLSTPEARRKAQPERKPARPLVSVEQ